MSDLVVKSAVQDTMKEEESDKLSNAISEDMWRNKHDMWMNEKHEIIEQLDSMDDHKSQYIKEGITLIELAQRTENIYKNASPEVKRKLVEIVSSNRVLSDGSIEFYYRKPFNWLAESSHNQGWWTFDNARRTLRLRELCACYHYSFLQQTHSKFGTFAETILRKRPF